MKQANSDLRFRFPDAFHQEAASRPGGSIRLVLAMMLLGLAALPLSVSAQPAEEDSLSSWQVDEGASLEQPAPEEPALQLKLDEAGVEVAPTEHWPGMGEVTTPEETERLLRLNRARTGRYVGLGAGGGLIAGGALFLGLSYMCFIGEEGDPGCPELPNRGLFNAGLILMAVGAAAMITSGAIYRDRKRKARKFEQAHHGTPRRVQWDLAQSRLVF
jgi:hypothetical protein